MIAGTKQPGMFDRDRMLRGASGSSQNVADPAKQQHANPD
jgi:hypothetical protein